MLCIDDWDKFLETCSFLPKDLIHHLSTQKKEVKKELIRALAQKFNLVSLKDFQGYQSQLQRMESKIEELEKKIDDKFK